jgi:hypothetical protein
MKNAKMLHKAILLNKNVPNGPEKFVPRRPKQCSNIPQKLTVKRYPGIFVVPLGVSCNLDQSSVLTKKKQLSQRFLRKLVTWNLKNLANMLQNWFPCSNQLRSVWIFLKKCAHVVEPIPEKFKNQWLKNGVMYPQRNLV